MFKFISRGLHHLRVLSFNHPAATICCPRIVTERDHIKWYLNSVSTRTVTTSSATQYFKEVLRNGKWRFQNAMRKVGFLDFSRTKLARHGYYIYEDVADKFDYQYFFEKFNLPDTFHSWFVVMELHLWMVLVRLMAEAEEGRFVRNMVIEAMWEDINQKSGLFGVENTATARAQIKILSEEFQAALVGYDEGLLSDDVVLAGALWRRFFSKECNDPELVEVLVAYIRRQIKHFDLLTKEDVLLHRKFQWLPLADSK